MNNRFFTDSEIALISTPSRWRIISSLMPCEVSPVDNPQHRQWMQTHTHCHENFQEIFIALQGHTFTGHRGEVYPVDPGTVCISDIGEEHDATFPGWSPYFRNLCLTTFANHVLVRIGTLKRHQDVPDPIRLILPYESLRLNVQFLLFNSQYQALLTPSLLRFHCCSTLGSIITYLICMGATEPQQSECGPTQEQIIISIQQRIQETAGKGMTLDTLAELSGYSRSYFSTLFKQHIGMSVHDYIDQCRAHKYYDLTLQGYSYKAISRELGFSDPSTFARWKKRVFNKRNFPEMDVDTQHPIDEK